MGGYSDAFEDGIEVIEGQFGRCGYIVPCEICGRKTRQTRYSRKRNYLCDYCKGKIKIKEKISLEHIKGIETVAEKRFKKAVSNIAKQVKNLQDYNKAIEIAETRAEKYGSVPEAMVAIELLKNKHKIIPQQKVRKYRVDFVLPELKMAIEVEGELFHRNIRDSDREATIQLSLGLEWKIVHIPAELIAKDIVKLEQAINISR